MKPLRQPSGTKTRIAVQDKQTDGELAGDLQKALRDTSAGAASGGSGVLKIMNNMDSNLEELQPNQSGNKPPDANDLVRSDYSPLRDVLASYGNSPFWDTWVSTLQKYIEEGECKHLQESPHYVAWLLISSEGIAYKIRKYLFAISKSKDGKAFDFGYKELLDSCCETMPEDVLEHAKFAIKTRHVLIHKGFPNPQVFPSQKANKYFKDDGFNEDEVWMIAKYLGDTNNYNQIKSRFEAVTLWLSSNTPSFTVE